jgi:hypothetical protein
MNRIILIGNGFDLAHQLKTSYHHFMSDYWEEFAQKYLETEAGKPYEDEFIAFQNTNGPKGGVDAYSGATYEGDPLCESFLTFVSKVGDVHCYNDLKLLIKEAKDSSGLIYKLTFKNDFWGHLCKTSCLETWVDIENEYYEELKKCLLSGTSDLTAVTQLNKDFEQVKSRLAVYLTKAFEQKITKNEDIEAIISSLVRLDDIAVAEQDTFLDNVLMEVQEFGGMYPDEIDEEMRKHPEYFVMNTEKQALRAMIRDKIEKGQLKDYMRPYVLLLNFNYSPTAKTLYAETKDWDYDLIHIHGELDNPANPMIFGYGDEIDEHYQKIVNSNKNDYLKNIKSIHYLETGQYRRLLSFIESAPYQVFIMGHSCGNSDRTLLNTLFEHKNCLSIKPFYYKKDDGTDDYINIVQNISRNFKDVSLMRDRVVNKTLCEPMPQNKP